MHEIVLSQHSVELLDRLAVVSKTIRLGWIGVGVGIGFGFESLGCGGLPRRNSIPIPNPIPTPSRGPAHFLRAHPLFGGGVRAQGKGLSWTRVMSNINRRVRPTPREGGCAGSAGRFPPWFPAKTRFHFPDSALLSTSATCDFQEQKTGECPRRSDTEGLSSCVEAANTLLTRERHRR
jgi:hypothetical protein